MRKVLTPLEASKESGIPVQRIRALIHAKKLNATNTSTGERRATWVIHRTDWENFLRPGSVEPTPLPSTNERLAQRRRRLDHGCKKYI